MSSAARPSRRARRARLWVGWLLAVAAIEGVFLGGVGVVMLVAGHVNPLTMSMAVLTAASTGYLWWFFGRGPGKANEPARSARPRRRAVAARSEYVSVAAFGASSGTGASECCFCGQRAGRGQRLFRGDHAAICEECAYTAARITSDTG